MKTITNTKIITLFIFFLDILIFYYAGRAVQGLPKQLVKKQALGIFLDRIGISHDLALGVCVHFTIIIINK